MLPRFIPCIYLTLCAVACTHPPEKAPRPLATPSPNGTLSAAARAHPLSGYDAKRPTSRADPTPKSNPSSAAALGTAPHQPIQQQPVDGAPSPPKRLAFPVPGEEPTATSAKSASAASTAWGTVEGSASPSSASLAPADPTQPCRILAIGDSLTDPNSHGGGYLALVAQTCAPCRITNLGHGADMTNQMRRRLLLYLDRDHSRYTHFVVFGGVNDLYSDETANRTLAKIEADLERMYAAGRERGARVIGVTVSPWGNFRRYYSERRGANTLRLNDWIRNGVGTRIEAVVDAYGLLSCGDSARLCPEYAHPFKDGIHFGPAGHRRLGEALRSALGPTFCPKSSGEAPSKGALEASGVGTEARLR